MRKTKEEEAYYGLNYKKLFQLDFRLVSSILFVVVVDGSLE